MHYYACVYHVLTNDVYMRLPHLPRTDGVQAAEFQHPHALTCCRDQAFIFIFIYFFGMRTRDGVVRCEKTTGFGQYVLPLRCQATRSEGK